MTVHILRGESHVVVSLTGWDAVWALKRSVEIPVATLRAVTVVEDPFSDRWRGLRLPGTSVPGFRAGSYRRGNEWRFYVARAREQALELELADHRYSKVIVRTDDPGADRESLAEVLAGSTD